jgi:hypothetical protein
MLQSYQSLQELGLITPSKEKKKIHLLSPSKRSLQDQKFLKLNKFVGISGAGLGSVC